MNDMIYISTRGNGGRVSSAQAIVQGLAPDGGLYVPETFPQLDEADFKSLFEMDYQGRAELVLSRYLTDFTAEEISQCVRGAYSGTFENDDPAPLAQVDDNTLFLELYHGPTCAFKDMALQLLPHLLSVSAAKVAPGRTHVILVATSGDTGKAALAGFADVPGVKIIVFYPVDGVSSMQKLQMITQEGSNVAVGAIKGNFDDAQSGVKAIFGDAALRKELADQGLDFSSANSINFGRLVPQIIYYVSAYCDLVKSGKIKAGEPFNVVVPTGNFGNILAAYYAKRMGVPVKKFICASNRNKVLTDFFETGLYDRNREFFTTTSPSMDILISSNLERMIYHFYGDDSTKTAASMAELQEKGSYRLAGDPAELQKLFYGAWCSDEEAAKEINRLFTEHRYLCDPHTAVASSALQRYRRETGDDTPAVVVSTASPCKFVPAVLTALEADDAALDEFAQLEKLNAVTGFKVPGSLAGLRSKAKLHTSCMDKTQMTDFIKAFLSK